MMEAPRIQYVKTSDGVNIAYATAGTGPAVVWIRNIFQSHLQQEWEQPIQRAGFENFLRAGATLVRFDQRGSGLSDRDVADISVAASTRDLEAVVDKLQLQRFSILAIEWGSATAINYAVVHPDRVSRLILLNPANSAGQTSRGQVWMRLSDDWELITETVAGMAFGFGYKEAGKYAEFMRAAIDHDTFLRYMAESVELSGPAMNLQMPTRVIRHTGIAWLSMESTRELVAAIPDCTMVAIEGNYLDHGSETGRAIQDFLGPDLEGSAAAMGESRGAPARSEERSSLRAVLFTDLVGHTAMMSRLGDDKGREVLREHERITREVLAAHGGTEVKTMGDGFMASFGSVTKAVECAVALQRKFEVRREKLEVEDLAVRIGLNAGEPIEEDGDLFGATVILASRIAGKAEGGEILVADTVRGLCSGKGFLFADRGEFKAKGFDEAVRVYEVKW